MSTDKGTSASRQTHSVELARAATDSNAVSGDRTTEQKNFGADRRTRIAEAAYRRAGVRNFEPGGELDDWLAAEREIDGD